MTIGKRENIVIHTNNNHRIQRGHLSAKIHVETVSSFYILVVLLFQVQFYKEPYKVSFLSETSHSFFKPGIPYVGHVSITSKLTVHCVSWL